MTNDKKPPANTDDPLHAAAGKLYTEETISENAFYWRSIETAPDDGTYILAIIKGMHPVTGKNFIPQIVKNASGAWVTTDDDSTKYEPTHWMPLPKPPAEGGK